MARRDQITGAVTACLASDVHSLERTANALAALAALEGLDAAGALQVRCAWGEAGHAARGCVLIWQGVATLRGGGLDAAGALQVRCAKGRGLQRCWNAGFGQSTGRPAGAVQARGRRRRHRTCSVPGALTSAPLRWDDRGRQQARQTWVLSQTSAPSCPPLKH